MTKERFGDEDFFYSLDEALACFNGEFAVVRLGSKTRILWDRWGEQGELAFFDRNSFLLSMANRRVWVDTPEGRKKIAVAPRWLEWEKRREFRDVEFFPLTYREILEDEQREVFNLWRGFSVSPDTSPQAERARKYSIFRDHLRTNIASGDEEIFRWLWTWFANLVQRPRDRPGTALVLRGRMGTGKTKVGEVIGSLFEAHYCLVDDPRYLVGQFNAHMESSLLLQVDEGFWAGDKRAEGRLKGLVTSTKQMMERKGADSVEISNYVRLIFTSNESWVIPAGVDERRFCVLDVAPHVAQNHDYFAEMDRQLKNGGREALFADLLAYDLKALDVPNIRVIPKTSALLEQKVENLGNVESWWFGRLCDGAITSRSSEWRESFAAKTLYADYKNVSEGIGLRRMATEQGFGLRMRKLVPDLVRKRVRHAEPDESGSMQSSLVWVYQLPALMECRRFFAEEIVRQDIDWVAWGAESAEETIGDE